MWTYELYTLQTYEVVRMRRALTIGSMVTIMSKPNLDDVSDDEVKKNFFNSNVLEIIFEVFVNDVLVVLP